MFVAKLFGDGAFDVVLGVVLGVAFDGELAGRAGEVVRLDAFVFFGVAIFLRA